MPIGGPASKLVWLVVLFTSSGWGQIQRKIAEPIYIDPHDERLIIEEGTPVPILLPSAFSTKRSTDIGAIVASPIFVNSTLIIKKGERVLLNMAVEKPKAMLVGGSILLYIEGVQTLVGDKVPLSKKMKVEAPGAGCEMACAFVLLMPWLKGNQADIPAGTLIEAEVSERIKIPALEARTASEVNLHESESIGVARIFVYMLFANPDDNTGWNSLTIKADGHKSLNLLPGMWSCMALPQGDHTVSFGEYPLSFSVSAGHDYYVKLKGVERDFPFLAEKTSGFQLEGQTLHFSTPTKKFQTDCW